MPPDLGRERHLAVLSIVPNTPGFSVVVTKRHDPS